MRKKRLNFRTTEEIKDGIEILAKEEKRSLSNYLEGLVEEHVNNNKTFIAKLRLKQKRK